MNDSMNQSIQSITDRTHCMCW